MQRQFWGSPTLIVGAVLTFGFIVTAVTFYPSQLGQIHRHWVTPDDQDMGYVLLAIGAWFFFSNLPSTPVKPRMLWLAPLGLLALGATAALVLNLTFPLLIYVFIAWALVIAVSLGHGSFALAVRSTALLSMALPMWYLFIPFQKDLTVLVTNQILGLFGLTFYLEGALFTVPTGSLIVADGCAGNKYLQAAVTMALLIWIFGRRNFKQLVSLLIVATIIALVANWVRVSALVILASWLGVDHSVVQDHDLLGWIIFAIGIVPFIYFNPIDFDRNDEPRLLSGQPTNYLTVGMCAAAGLLIFMLPTVIAGVIQEQRSAGDLQLSLPNKIAGFSRNPTLAATWQPDFSNFSQEYTAVYVSKDQTLDAVVLAYRDYSSSHKLTSWTNSVLDRESWNVLTRENILKPGGGVMQLLSARGPMGQTRSVLFWYGDFDQRGVSFFTAKVFEAKNLFVSDYANAVYAFSAECGSDCQGELSALKALAAEI